MSLASRKLIQATAGATTVDTGDDDFANVVLLLDGDGTSDDNNNTFTDSSTNGFAVTESGSVVQGSFSPYGDNWSNYFDGVDDAVYTASSTGLVFGTGDFTIECWAYRSADPNSYSRIFNFGHYNDSNSVGINFDDGDYPNKLTFFSNTLGGRLLVSTTSVSSGEWYHIAVTRESGTFKLWLNGSLEDTDTTSGSVEGVSTQLVAIGSAYNRYVQEPFNGYISNARIVKGTAVYTSAFTPPTTPLTAISGTQLLLSGSNSFVDESSNNLSLTLNSAPKVTPFSPFKNDDARTLTTDGGSAYFNYGPYLTLPQNTAFNFGTGDFTVEFWANVDTYRTSGSYYDAFLTFGFYTSSPYFRIHHDGRLACGLVSAEYYSTSTIDTGEWNHYAISRSGTTLRIFVNGTLETTATHSASLGNSAAVTVGTSSWQANNEEMKGYLSDVRIVKGSAVYTSSFTPPTAPLTAVTNTSALLSFQDAGIYDRSGINNLDTVGDARLGFAPIYGTGSLAFDGTGDYLSVQNENDLFTVGSGDYTVECWINTSDTVGEIVSAFSQSSPFPGWLFGIGFPEHDGSKNGLLSFYQANSTNNETKYSTARVDDGSWHHVAISKSGTTLRFFIDGALDSTHTLSYVSTGSGQPIRIGADNNTGPVRYLDGYIDDLRITKGVARYTSNFTPPDEIDLSTDTYAEYVTLFLDGDGTVNGQNNTFTDSSTNGFTVTESGSVVQGVFSPYGDNWSNYFSSNNYYTAASDASFNLGTGDFTVEAWVNPTQYTTYNYICTMVATGGLTFYVTGGTLKVRRYFVADVLSSSTIPEIGEWTHVAATRSGTTLRIFVNGVQTATTTDSTNYAQGNFAVGNDSTNAAPWYGNISNLRVLKGTALYTSNFTPPTSPLTNITNTSILTAQSNRFVDNSSNSHALTITNTPKVSRFSPFESDKPYDITTDGGSGYFDGSIAYLNTDINADLLGSSSFTIEGWLNLDDATNAHRGVFDLGSGYLNSAVSGPALAWFTDKWRIYYTQGGVGYTDSSTTSIERNRWYHFAYVRNASTNITKLYIDGTEVISVSDNTNYTNRYLSVGGYYSTSYLWKGNISDFRITESAVYTSAFTPPTAPLTAIANTSLLLNFQDSAIPDLSGINNIDTVGNAKVGGTDPTKYGSNAMQFDGSGDYLLSKSDSSLYAFGSGDFTIEMWIHQFVSKFCDQSHIRFRALN